MPSSKRAHSPMDSSRDDDEAPSESHAAASSTVPAAAANPSASTPSSGAPATSSSTTPTTSTAAPAGPGATASKRRRGLGVVTPNACTECRKKRAKCDGQKPCGRCKSQKNVECVYEIPVRQSKENLRHEIEHLRRQQQASDSVISALAQTEQWEDILTRLRQGQSVESISEWLGAKLPSGTGPLPTFGRVPGVASNLTSLAQFGGGSAHSYTPGMASTAASGANTLSPMTAAQPQSARQEHDPNSPWSGHFSSTSQTHSTRSGSFPDAMSWGPGPPQMRVGSWNEDELARQHQSSEAQRYRGLDQVLAPEMPELKVPASTWTSISSDSDLVQHLLALYFCWEYPTFASLSKEHFLKDFQSGRARFCSPILVNALLALGCRFSSQPSTRANPEDPYSSGDHFFKECQRLFYLENDHHTLTTIQALGIMSIREASCGRDSESWYYAGQSIRLAVEMGLHRMIGDGSDEDETAVQAATFWGAFALDHAWSLATGTLPQCSCFPHLPPKPAIIDDIEASLWIPYTDNGAPLQRSCEQPSNVRSVYKCFCELSELVHQSLYILHSPGRPLTSRDLLNIYTQYLDWYDKIPEVLRLGHNFTPAVLFAHMYYHFAILLLFRPLIKLRIIGSSLSPRDVCSQAADAIQGLTRSYSQLYTLRRTPSFVPYFVLTSSIMHLAIGAISNQESAKHPTADVERDSFTQGPGPQSQPQTVPPVKDDQHVIEAINRGIADLTEMAPCHHFAEQALNILRYLAKKWHIKVTVDVDRDLERGKREEGEEGGGGGGAQVEGQAANTLEYPTPRTASDSDDGVRPVTHSLNFFAPNVREQDYVSVWGSAAQQPMPVGSATPPVARTSDSMENPLFWPFPMQGRPMLSSGDMLKEAGFELIV